VKKEGSKVVSPQTSKTGRAFPTRFSSWRRRTGNPTAMDAVFFFFFFRAWRALLLCLTAYHYRSRRAATTSLRRRIGNPRAREASTPRRFTENLVTTADGATFRAVFL
jgi:hypothetical protein